MDIILNNITKRFVLVLGYLKGYVILPLVISQLHEK